jgi:purine-nucleoside phosphorylase
VNEIALNDQIVAAAEAVQRHWSMRPEVAIVLGTGLGNFAQQIVAPVRIPYNEVPYFPRATALAHKGQFVCGTVADVPVIAMEGRFHCYEGYSAAQVALPVYVMRRLGARILILSNAAGGVHPRLRAGDIVAIEDQINLMFRNPLLGANDSQLGPRFPDMSAPYDAELIEQTIDAGHEGRFVVHRGVYAGVLGPNYETRAEYRFLRRIGADVVGMSTVPEVIVARHVGMRVLGLSAVTNVCSPDDLSTTSGDAVVQAAAATEPKLRHLVTGVLKRWAATRLEV